MHLIDLSVACLDVNLLVTQVSRTFLHCDAREYLAVSFAVVLPIERTSEKVDYHGSTHATRISYHPNSELSPPFSPSFDDLIVTCFLVGMIAQAC